MDEFQGEKMDYYILLELNRKEIKIMDIKEEQEKIVVELKSRKEKVRCTICNKFTSSVHDKLKPIRSIYLDSFGKEVNLIITKRRFNCYKCNKSFR